MIKIILLGAGNVGHHLSKVFNKSKQIDLVQWYCRDKNKITLSSLDTEIIDDLANIKSADIYVISISDSYVGDLSKELNISDKLVVHTSGSLNFTVLDNKNRRGVFYPLQTFSKNKELEISKVPICIEAENNKDLMLLEKISKYYKMQMDYKMDNLSKAIEPILLAVIFAMVGFLAMAIFMPIWKMSSAVRGK